MHRFNYGALSPQRLQFLRRAQFSRQQNINCILSTVVAVVVVVDSQRIRLYLGARHVSRDVHVGALTRVQSTTNAVYK